MAAGMASKNIFTSPYQKKLKAYHIKMGWSEGSLSDPITVLNAYKVYKNLEHVEHFRRSGETERMRKKRWAEISCIQLKALQVRHIEEPRPTLRQTCQLINFLSLSLRLSRPLTPFTLASVW